MEYDMQEQCGILTKQKYCGNKLNLCIIGGLIVLILLLAFYVYRFITQINKRFQSLEDIMAKVVEKTNHLQHLLQLPPQPPQPLQPLQPTQPPQPPQQKPLPQRPPVVIMPNQTQQTMNLDKELAEELKELDVKSKEDELPEGRIDEENK